MKNEITAAILRKLADKLLTEDYEEGDSYLSCPSIAQGIKVTTGDDCGATGHAVIHLHDGVIEIAGGSFSLQSGNQARFQKV